MNIAPNTALICKLVIISTKNICVPVVNHMFGLLMFPNYYSGTQGFFD